MKMTLSPQQIMAGQGNKARAAQTSAVFASEDGATDILSTRSLDKPAQRLAGGGFQGEFVQRYFNDPDFQNKINGWNMRFQTSSNPGLEFAQAKMQTGQPLI